MNRNELKELWKQEEQIAHIHGWDFSHLHGRYEEEQDIPWDYDSIVRQYLKKDMKLLDYDTGGGEFLLTLGHPYENTAATEGFPPNVALCRETLTPLGIDLRECSDPARLPFEDSSFDIVINRHGDFCPEELSRVVREQRPLPCVRKEAGAEWARTEEKILLREMPDRMVPDETG